MTTSSGPNPEQTGLSTQYLPITPAIQVMKSWDTEKVLRWIQQREPNILDENDIDNFKKARITGRTFLAFNVEFFESWGLLLAPLIVLVDEVKYQDMLSKQTAEDETDAPEQSISSKRNRRTIKASKRRKIRSTIPTTPSHQRVTRSWSPSTRASSPYREDAFGDNADVIFQWKEFYARARAIRGKGPYDKNLEEKPFDLFNASDTTLNETFEKIEKEEHYNFPKDGDPSLQAACEALSHALQKAGGAKVSRAEAEHDTPEVTQALDNLRKTYDEAAKSNTVSMHYIDTEPPYIPYSPLEPAASLKRILLARSWVKELITEIHAEDSHRKVLVLGKPGCGKSVTLVGYLLFYLIALRARVILQAKAGERLGIIFDDDGVRGVSVDAEDYADGKPCYLLVSADGPDTSPLIELGFCTVTIVVTSPNLKANLTLKAWQKRADAYHFISPPPSCPEVVYLFSKVWLYDSYLVYWMYQEWTRDFRVCRRDCGSANYHIKNGTLLKWYEEKTQSIKAYARAMLAGVIDPGLHPLPDESNMTIPSDLVTVERRNDPYMKYELVFMTQRIADIVFDVQEEADWQFNESVLNVYFRNPETRATAGKKFEEKFLQKYQRDPSKMPPCFEIVDTNDRRPSCLDERADMPWDGLDQQPTLEYISIGTDADGSLYSGKELQAVMVAAIDNGAPSIHFLYPCARDWATWDAAIIRYAEKNGKRAVHVIFLQATADLDHRIYAKGLNQVRDAIPAEWKYDRGLDVYYHYVLVLFVGERSNRLIPKWRPVSVSSTEREKDPSWSSDDLKQYVMFVAKKELFKRD